MKTRILKITAVFLTAILLFAIFPISAANVNAADQDQEICEFVTRLYKVCLKRDPDNDGLNYWVSELKDKRETGVAVASGFIFSKELQEKSYSNEDYVNIMYDAFFGREADTDGFNYWVKCMNDGMTRQEIFTGFANSNEFFELCGSFDVVAGTYMPNYDPNKVNRTNFFVERLYEIVLGRKCDRDGMKYWTDELLSGRISGTSTAYGFFFSAEYENSNKYYSEYIDDLYNALMGRQADDSGRNFWFNGMKNGSTKEQVFNGFAMSPEFKSICADYGIVQGSKISEDKNTTNTLRPDSDKNNSNGSSNSGNNSGSSSSSSSGNNVTTAPAQPTTSGNSITVVSTDIKIENSNLKIMNGCSGQIKFVDKNNNEVKVSGATFKSDNETVAFALEDGTVIGLSVGTTVFTVNYLDKTSYVYVSVEKYVSSINSIPDSLTPQDFGAYGDGIHDDTQAFREMFAAAATKPYTTYLGWKHCQAIYIPSGKYVISGPIVDGNLKDEDGKPLEFCMFEVTGSGRESSSIMFTGDVLFESRNSAKRTIFAFTTFRDIGFSGNDSNTFMTMCQGTTDGTQRMQFISCRFEHFHHILFCEKSYVMLSEITFAYCRIADCGKANNHCELFVLNDSMSVDWRFVETDMEGLYGSAFLYESGASVNIHGGSYISNQGALFDFDFDTTEKASTAGASNSPHLLCEAAHFEMKTGEKDWNATLLRSNCVTEGFPNVIFRSCKMGTTANRPAHYLELDGSANILFDSCFDCEHLKVHYDMKKAITVKPHLTFKNCVDVSPENLIKESTIEINTEKTQNGNISVNGDSWSETNNVRVTIDNSYDFYLFNSKGTNTYVHTVVGLNKCEQQVNVGSGANGLSTLSNGKTIKNFKPFGYVESVNITIPDYQGGEVTVTLYDNGKQIGQTKLKKGTSSYSIKVGAYVDNPEIKFTHSLSSSPQVKMNISISKY